MVTNAYAVLITTKIKWFDNVLWQGALDICQCHRSVGYLPVLLLPLPRKRDTWYAEGTLKLKKRNWEIGKFWKSRGITQEQEKIINFEIDPDLLFMVPDFVHEMVWLVEIKILSWVEGKQKLHVFPLTLHTLILCAYPKVFLAIF